MATWKTFGFDIDTKKYLDAVAVTGGSINYGTTQLVDNFVSNLKSAAVWDNILDCGIFVGNDFNTACVKLKWSAGASPYLISGGGFQGDAYTERSAIGGVSGNGAGFLDTRIPQNMFLPQNRHMSVYCNLLSPTANSKMIGSDVAVNRDIWSLEQDTLSTNFVYQCGNGSAGPLISGMVTGGQYVGINSVPNILYVNAQGTGLSSANPTISPCTGTTTQYILALNRNGAATDQSRARISFYSIGLSLTPSQISGFYSAVQGLQSGLGRAV